MAVYTETKTYHTKAHMGMIDVTEDFRHAVEEAARQKNIRNFQLLRIPFRSLCLIKIGRASCRERV